MTVHEKGPRILLVEDEPANRALVRAILDRSGRPELETSTLHEASTIGEARSVLATYPLDIVLVDVRLPDGSGLDLVGELRAHPHAERAAIAIVSASVLEADRALARATGADAFLAKPFGASDLTRLLVGLLAS